MSIILFKYASKLDLFKKTTLSANVCAASDTEHAILAECYFYHGETGNKPKYLYIIWQETE